MAYTAILQDWITLQGDNTHTTGALPPENEYLNVSGVQDIAFYIMVSQSTGTGLALSFESAPLKEEAFFLPLATAAAVPTPSATPTVQLFKYTGGTSTNPPLSAWLRWRLSGSTAAWSVTMRIVVALNPNTVGFSGSGGGIATAGVIAGGRGMPLTMR